MAYWLLKTEAKTFSWEDLVKRGKEGEPWTGVRNFSARSNLKAMKKGDRAFFYHTGDEKRIVGVVEVVREAYHDPTAPANEPWVVVNVKATKPMPKPVTLAEIKANLMFKDMALVKYARLSVQPVTPMEWTAICRMGGLKAP
jgi:predicted RNA-binding protein with PUA-like domain